MHELLLVKIAVVVVKRVKGEVRSLFGRFVYVIKTVWEELIMWTGGDATFAQFKACLIYGNRRVVDSTVGVDVVIGILVVAENLNVLISVVIFLLFENHRGVNFHFLLLGIDACYIGAIE